MGILDKAKDTISKATESAKDKIDDVIDRRKADDLLDEIGRIVYRQHTGRGSAEDEADIARLVAELQALEAEGTEIDDTEVPEQ